MATRIPTRSVFGRVVENLDGFALMCKRLRYEGTKPMTTRPFEAKPRLNDGLARGRNARAQGNDGEKTDEVR
jgi:hypothetical protein